MSSGGQRGSSGHQGQRHQWILRPRPHVWLFILFTLALAVVSKLYHQDVAVVNKLYKDDDTLIGTFNDMYCTAHVEANNIAATSVVDEHGNLNLFLPLSVINEKAFIKCTRYNLTTGFAIYPPGANYSEEGRPIYESHYVQVSGVYYHSPCNKDIFQYGYFNRSSKLWHEPCNAAGSKTWMEYLKGNESKLYENNQGDHNMCPTLNQKDGSWISLVGDSVVRAEFIDCVPTTTPMRRWGPPVHPKDKSIKNLPSNGEKDYMTHHVAFMHPTTTNYSWERYGPASNWSQFVEFRKEGKVEGDPPNGSKQPDVIIFGAGYHATSLSVQEFRDALEKIFKLFDKQAKERLANGLCQPPMYYMNNIMPAPELIPDKYSTDFARRTFINEYWKNRAVLDLAKEYPSIQVIDFMSVELLFNDEGAHVDAVHLSNKGSVKNLLLDVLLNSILA